MTISRRVAARSTSSESMHGSIRTIMEPLAPTAGVSRRATGPAIWYCAFADGNVASSNTSRVVCRSVPMTGRSPRGGTRIAAVCSGARAVHGASLSRAVPEWKDTWRLPSGFNRSAPGADPRGWISEGYFGLDQGVVVLMIENYRSGLIWKLMRNSGPIRTGLNRAGFTGGWL